MSRDVEVGSPDMTIGDVAKKMRDGNFGMMPVGENDRLIGAISIATSRFGASPRARAPAPKFVT